jgi:hypothetical protein
MNLGDYSVEVDTESYRGAISDVNDVAKAVGDADQVDVVACEGEFFKLFGQKFDPRFDYIAGDVADTAPSRRVTRMWSRPGALSEFVSSLDHARSLGSCSSPPRGVASTLTGVIRIRPARWWW